jgi:uncharacterized protein YodC (DUF2158 family)
MPKVPLPFELGDIVELVTGGPDLVVLGFCEECEDVEVAWFNDQTLEVAKLPAFALTFVTVH